MNKIDTILDYWFEGVDDKTKIDVKNMPFKKWFIKNEKMDEEIRRQFESDILAAADGQYKGWEDTARGRLALIILFDQFSRNMYRDTAQMYAYDPLALKLTLGALGQDKEQELLLIERTFLYMPLMHSEDLKRQQLSLKCFSRLVAESKVKNPDNMHYYEYTLKYAQEHHDTVAQSGRFPHRDSILSRVV